MMLRIRRISAAVGLILMTTTTIACNTFLPSQFQSNRDIDTSDKVAPQARKDFLAAWVGKKSSDLEKTFGRPTRIEPIEITGGSRYFYRAPGQPHYIFELDARNKVVNAAQID